jgi:glyoxylase-like metal-dependent hydrolase (beta-lactamase superfamily II)
MSSPLLPARELCGLGVDSIVEMPTKDIFSVYPFRVGSQDGWAIPDGFLWGEPVQQYAIDVSDAEIVTLFGPYFLDPHRIQLSMSPILFRWGPDLILVDTGIGNVLGAPVGLLHPGLSALGIKPEEISAVLLTHLHVDHVGGSFDPVNKKSLFPRARVFISEAEIEFWSTPNPDISELRDVPTELIDLTIKTARDALDALAQQLKPFGPENELLPGIGSIPLPGHTPGQSGYLFNSEGSQFLVVGDAMHDPVLHIQRPEWTSMGDARRQQTVKTRRQLLARLADEKLRFQGFHFPFPGIGHVRRNGIDRFEFVPERWTWPEKPTNDNERE